MRLRSIAPRGRRYDGVVLVRIALAQLPYPPSPEDAVERVVRAMRLASNAGAAVIAFPECYVPGYRGLGRAPPAPDAASLERAWHRIERAAGELRIGAVVGTERAIGERSFASVLVVDANGERLGFQDKVQLDPSEGDAYVAGEERHVFTIGALKFGVVICHEGWRYPETVRFAVRRGAHVVFHPHLHDTPGPSFHEGAMLARAAENTAYFASVNYAVPGAGTTSSIVAPNGVFIVQQLVGIEGVLVADVDTEQATGFLARRYRVIHDLGEL
jgi:predicted amidohydrolase